MITRRLATAGLAATFAGLARGGSAQTGAEVPDLAENGLIPVWSARPFSKVLGPDPSRLTEIWGFNGKASNILRARAGSELRFILENRTPLPLSLHCMGVRGSNAMDGIGGLTQDPVLPGQRFEYRFTPPDSGTFLVRPCVLGGSAEPMARGLSGLLIVDEASPPPIDHDLPLLIDDWLVKEDGSLAAFGSSESTPLGRLGNVLTVNGEPTPRALEFPPGTRLRLRLANGCNARSMRLHFDGLKPYVAAIDSQPTDTFEPLRGSLPFAPGTRYDLLLDMPEESGSIGQISAMIGQGVPLLKLTAAGERQATKPAIAPLRQNPRLPPAIPLQKGTRKDLILRGGPDQPWSLNGLAGIRGTPPLIAVKRGSTVVLALKNETGLPQPFHLHGHSFRLLHPFDDGWEPYFLDTVQVPENKTVRIAFVADNPGRWLLASTVMERFDAGLWTWFEVT